MKSYAQKAWASLRKGDAQQTKQQFDVLLREGIRKRFGQHFDEAHRSFLEEELYVIGARGAECLFLQYLDVLNNVKRFAFPYVCSIQNTSLVCYCLGITQVDPVMTHSRFERFLSLGAERTRGFGSSFPARKKRRFPAVLIPFPISSSTFVTKNERLKSLYSRRNASFCARRSKILPSLRPSFPTVCLQSRRRKRSRNMCIFARRSVAGSPNERGTCCLRRTS